MTGTKLRDQNGIPISVLDRLRFYYYDGCVWDGTVIFEDGMATIDISTPSQVSNPLKWDMPHEWIKSRSWACIVGYGEYGTWSCPRRPLTQIAEGWRDYDGELKPLYEKHGHLGGRIIKAEIISAKGAKE